MISSSGEETFGSTLGSSKSLTCFEAIKKLSNEYLARYAFVGKEHELKMSFSKYIFKYQTDFDADILPLLKVKLNVVKLNSRNKIVLIYDNRFLSFVEPSWPEVCWILNMEEKIIKEGWICLSTEDRYMCIAGWASRTRTDKEWSGISLQNSVLGKVRSEDPIWNLREEEITLLASTLKCVIYSIQEGGGLRRYPCTTKFQKYMVIRKERETFEEPRKWIVCRRLEGEVNMVTFWRPKAY